jgi:hypothetical protein
MECFVAYLWSLSWVGRAGQAVNKKGRQLLGLPAPRHVQQHLEGGGYVPESVWEHRMLSLWRLKKARGCGNAEIMEELQALAARRVPESH